MRCDLHRAAEGTCAAKYDPSCASLLALLRYGSGLPFYRIEGLQASLHVPLPDATQWDLVVQAVPAPRAVFGELIRQAGQGDLLHCDDTRAKILSLIVARNQLEAAKKGLAMQGEQVEVASFNLRYSKITAPANGSILKKLAEANELVGPGTPVLLFGSKDKSKVIRVNLTDKDIIHGGIGNEAEIQFDAYPGHTFKGEVREVASMADPYTNTYEVEVEVRPEGKTLLSGFIGSVSIFTSTTASLMEIPIGALIGAHEMQGEVFVAENGKAVKTTVSIFKAQGEKLLIERGLDSTDKVITSGVGYLADEQPIMISQR